MTDHGAPGPPLPDYDSLSVGDIAHRARSLDAAGLERLIQYEHEHAARTPVLELLDKG